MWWFRNMPAYVKHITLHFFKFCLRLCLRLIPHIMPSIWSITRSYLLVKSFWTLSTMAWSIVIRRPGRESHRNYTLIFHVKLTNKTNYLFEFLLMPVCWGVQNATSALRQVNLASFNLSTHISLSNLRWHCLILDTLLILSFCVSYSRFTHNHAR